LYVETERDVLLALEQRVRALDRVLREGKTLPRDLGGRARTVELAEAIIAAM
jgi:isocitrate/isopropylmalate dehydrogenase